MKKYLLNFIKLAVSLGLGVALVFWMVSHMTEDQRQKTIDAFKRANYFWIALAPILGIISNFSRAQRWRLLLEPTGSKPGFWNTFFSVMMMYFFNLFFPRLGEVTRCTVLARYEKVPVDKSIGTMVVERFVDLLSILVIGGLLFLFETKKLVTFWKAKDSLSQTQGAGTGGSSMVTWIVLAAAAVAIAGFMYYLFRKHGAEKLREMMKEKVMGFIEGLKSIRYLRSPWEFLFHTVVIWLCYFLMIYLSFPALTETAGMSVLAGMACLFCGGFGMVLSPGGVGFYPLFVQFVLGKLYGVDMDVAYAFGSIVWAAQMAAVMVGGVISLILLAILNKESSLNTQPLKTAP